MDKSNVVNLFPTEEEKRWELFLTQITKDIFGPYVLSKIPDWKYMGPKLQDEDTFLMQLTGWKKMMFSISDIVVDQIKNNSSIMNHEEIHWKSESLKGLRILFWAIMKLKYFPGKEMVAKSSNGEVILVEDPNFRKIQCH